VSVDITNNGTVPVSGFNLYLQTTEKAPSSSSTAVATNNQTFIAPGETVSVPFEFRPSLARSYFIYATDANRQVITHTPVNVVDPSPSFTLRGIDATVSSDTVMVGGMVFQKLNNNSVNVFADISNHADSTPGQPTVKLLLDQWDPETGEVKSYKNKNVNTVAFGSGERKAIEHTFNRLNEGLYLIFHVSADDMAVATADTLLRFVVGEPSLAVDTVVDGKAVLSGAWDATAFASLAHNSSITAYDLRGVSGVRGSLSAANPNALFYVSVPAEGPNVIQDGRCADLRLTAGYDFRPLEPF
jgi:hypothetical protein